MRTLALSLLFVSAASAFALQEAVPAGNIKRINQQPGSEPPAAPDENAPAAKSKKSPIKPIPVRFQATVYQVDIPTDRIAALDAKSLAEKASTATALEAALKGLGEARALYRVDQNIDLRRMSKVRMSSNIPVVTSTSTVGDKKTSSITRESLGAQFDVASSLDSDEALTGPIPLSINVEFSTLAESNVDVGGAPAKVTRTVLQSNVGTVRLGKPLVLITADAVGDLATGKKTATAFVTLIEVSSEEP